MLTHALPRTSQASPKPHLGAHLPMDGHSAFHARKRIEKPLGFGRTFSSEEVDAAYQNVRIVPENQAKRRSARWRGMSAEIVQVTSSEPVEFCYKAPLHMLVLVEQGTRRDGETSIGGLRSSLRDTSRKLTFVPAGHDYRDRYEPRNPPRMVFFYIAPNSMPSQASSGGASLSPRLLFEDAMVLSTAQKIAHLIEGLESDSSPYLEALGLVLQHELMRLYQGSAPIKQTLRGGLASWQQRTVTGYIEDHLAEAIPLQVLAGLAGLSTYHFCRAFKQSFGVPPHRYHTRRRIERAKELLARSNPSVTEIGLEVGFSETSAFTASFRKIAGLTPTAYRRSLV